VEEEGAAGMAVPPTQIKVETEEMGRARSQVEAEEEIPGEAMEDLTLQDIQEDLPIRVPVYRAEVQEAVQEDQDPIPKLGELPMYCPMQAVVFRGEIQARAMEEEAPELNFKDSVVASRGVETVVMELVLYLPGVLVEAEAGEPMPTSQPEVLDTEPEEEEEVSPA